MFVLTPQTEFFIFSGDGYGLKATPHGLSLQLLATPNFFWYNGDMNANIVSIPFTAREVRATEAVLDRVYAAAHKGMKGDSLALAAGLLPVEFRRLCELDPHVEMMALKGKADSELTHATKLHEASMMGDAKASLAILQHVHGWAAKQQIEHTTTVEVSIRTLLEEREAQIKGMVYEHDNRTSIGDATNAESRVLPVSVKVRNVGISLGESRPETLHWPEAVASGSDAGVGTVFAAGAKAEAGHQHAA